MRGFTTLLATMILAAVGVPAFAGPDAETEDWLETAAALAEADTDATVAVDASTEHVAPAAPVKGPPLPFHCIEGYSGGAITPMAYFANAGADGAIASLPSAAAIYLNMGSKKLYIFSITQVLFNRIEFGYAYQYLDVGSLYDDVKKAGLDMGRDHVQMHHFNLRGQLLPENSCDLPLPAIVAGIHFKYNDGIEQIDKSLGGAFKGLGYERQWGIDYTLTASKTFPKLAFGRPVILTGGLRLSNAAQTGLFGFGNEYNATFEGSVAYMPTDFLVLCYEFRGKNNPYSELAKLVDREQNWHALSASILVNDRLTITGMYGSLGNIGNAHADCTLVVQVKYEF